MRRRQEESLTSLCEAGPSSPMNNRSRRIPKLHMSLFCDILGTTVSGSLAMTNWLPSGLRNPIVPTGGR